MKYNYKCDSCGSEFTEEQSIHDKPLVKCPKCEKDDLYRVIKKGAGVVLTGGGWGAGGINRV